MKKKTSFDDVLKKIPEDKRYIGEKLIEELTFLEGTLSRLKSQILEDGELEHFQQGKQKVLEQSSFFLRFQFLVLNQQSVVSSNKCPSDSSVSHYYMVVVYHIQTEQE